MNFTTLKAAIAKQFERMQKYQLYRVGTTVGEDQDREAVKAADRDAVYATYLASFPEGTNPIYRERSEHDCSCCKNFIRSVGNVVAIIDGKVETIWDVKVAGEPGYQKVVDALAKQVKAMPIQDVFLHFEKTVGTDRSFEDTVNGVKRWDHFFVNVKPAFVAPNSTIATTLGAKRQLKEVFHRGLTEIDLESIDTVLELIGQNTVYRGAENKFAVEGFRKAKVAFDKLKTDAERDQFAWENSLTVHGAVAGIRNNAIGKLLQDLAGGMDVDRALSSFETLMGAANYKRPTAAVTPKMIEAAKKTIQDLGRTSAMPRRYAVLSDISVNDILFADRNAKRVMTGDVFDELAADTSAKVKVSEKIEEIGIEKFITDVLPKITSMEVLLENRHASNLVSLIAPEDPTALGLFKWGNNFSWSYKGGMADSIKERVKAQGGITDAALRVSLAWFNSDDLDIHVIEPDGHEIAFPNKGSRSRNTGMLDVDMNAYGPHSDTEPVENVVWTRPMDGTYRVIVENFNKRTANNAGFVLQVEDPAGLQEYKCNSSPSTRQKNHALVLHVKAGRVVKVEAGAGVSGGGISQNIWGLPTQTYHKVNLAMLSPNFWHGKTIGNQHYFFMLDGCANDAGDARGFLNEFLMEELTPHRKVFEMIGSRIKVSGEDNQLSGLGFSSTQRNDLVVRVKGSFTRNLKIVF